MSTLENPTSLPMHLAQFSRDYRQATTMVVSLIATLLASVSSLYVLDLVAHPSTDLWRHSCHQFICACCTVPPHSFAHSSSRIVFVHHLGQHHDLAKWPNHQSREQKLDIHRGDLLDRSRSADCFVSTRRRLKRLPVVTLLQQMDYVVDSEAHRDDNSNDWI